MRKCHWRFPVTLILAGFRVCGAAVYHLLGTDSGDDGGYPSLSCSCGILWEIHQEINQRLSRCLSQGCRWNCLGILVHHLDLMNIFPYRNGFWEHFEYSHRQVIVKRMIWLSLLYCVAFSLCGFGRVNWPLCFTMLTFALGRCDML